MSKPCELKTAFVNKTLIIKICGDATSGTADYLFKIGKDAVKSVECESIIMDLSETRYMDSTYIGTISQLSLALHEQNGCYIDLVNVSKSVKNTLLIMGINQICQVFECDCKLENFPQELQLKNHQIPDVKDRELLIRILHSHECLINLNDNNVQCFQDLVKIVRKEAKEKFGIKSDG